MFDRGVGKGKGPVEYCIHQVVPAFDSDTRRRIPGEFVTRIPPPVVLKGDPSQTVMLIDSSMNQWKYTSGVIAFTETDNPSDIEIDSVIDSFENMAFAGLDKDQYNILWIKHVHEGNVELHFVSPRLELSTGKALNIAPPSHEQLFNSWRDSLNYSKGWASPDEPARAILSKQDGYILKKDSALLKAGLSKSDDPKRLIGEYLIQRIEAGKVENRDDVLASLRDAGFEIHRHGADYISVREQGATKSIRLKGVLYGNRFETSYDRAGALRAELAGEFGGTAQGEDAGGGWRNPAADRERAAAASEKLNRFIAARTVYNTKRYRQPSFEDRTNLGRDIAAGSELNDSAGGPDRSGISAGRGADNGAERRDTPEPGQHTQYTKNGFGSDNDGDQIAANGSANASLSTDKTPSVDDENPVVFDSFGSPHRLPDSVRRDLGLDDIQAGSAAAERDASGSESRPDSADNRPSDSTVLRNTRRPEIVPAAVKKPSWYDTIQTKIKALYDRTRTAIIDRISAAFDAVRRGHEALGKSELAYAGAAANLERSVAKNDAAIGRSDQAERDTRAVFAASSQHIDGGIKVIQQRQGDELEQFKTQINLVEYAEAQGYEIDLHESSKASAVLRRAEDKIVVATDADGHGIYFSVRDDSDNGSIIDFVQKRERLNLGQVRKVLRPWVGGYPSTYAPKAPAPMRRKPQPTSGDRRQVLAVWSKMAPTNGNHSYLTIQREIEPATQADPRFVGSVRIDSPHGNAVFPHYDEDGITGYELKNEGFTGFAKGGEKALWHSSNFHDSLRLVVVESGIDALSHAELMQDSGAAYVSVGGSMSDKQRDLLTKAITRLQARGGTLIVATDSDPAGEALASEISALVPGMSGERQAASRKDWNDALIALKNFTPLAVTEEVVFKSELPRPG
jgi:hypothetical protein